MFGRKKLPFFFDQSDLEAFRTVLDAQNIPHRVYYGSAARNAGTRGIIVDQFAPQNVAQYQIIVPKKYDSLTCKLAQEFLRKKNETDCL